MKTKIVCVLLLIGLVVYINHSACNKPGTLADKINWAGHNCKGK